MVVYSFHIKTDNKETVNLFHKKDNSNDWEPVKISETLKMLLDKHYNVQGKDENDLPKHDSLTGNTESRCIPNCCKQISSQE